MKMLASMAAGACLCVLPAGAQERSHRLSPPVNIVQSPPAQAQTPGDTPAEAADTGPRQSMVIEEDGTVRFLTPEEAAGLFIPPGATSTFNVEFEQSETGPDSLHIDVTGAEISESVTSDGSVRVLRIVPDDGSPSHLITITKD